MYEPPKPPTNTQELIDQLNLVKSFCGSAVKCLNKQEDDMAYILADRARDLLKQIQEAIEDLEP